MRHSKSTWASLPDFDLKIALTLLNEFNALLIDVRTYEEFCKGHLKEAILIPTPVPPLSKREKQTLKSHIRYILKQETRNKKHPIVIYCKKGIRATAAKQIIENMGYIHVTVLGGVEESPIKEIISGKNPIWKTCKCNN